MPKDRFEYGEPEIRFDVVVIDTDDEQYGRRKWEVSATQYKITANPDDETTEPYVVWVDPLGSPTEFTEGWVRILFEAWIDRRGWEW